MQRGRSGRPQVGEPLNGQGAGAFKVTRAEDVDTVLRDVETFSSRDIIGRTPTEAGSGPTGPWFYLIDTDAPERSRL